MVNLYIGALATTEILLIILFGLIPLILFCCLIIAIIRYLNREKYKKKPQPFTDCGFLTIIYI